MNPVWALVYLRGCFPPVGVQAGLVGGRGPPSPPAIPRRSRLAVFTPAFGCDYGVRRPGFAVVIGNGTGVIFSGRIIIFYDALL